MPTKTPAHNTRFAASGGKLFESRNMVFNEKSSYLKILSLNSPPGANRGNVSGHPKATVQTLNYSNKWTDKKPTLRQNQKRCNATHKPTYSCTTFAFAPTARQF
jgi:hypothetical protein